MLGGEETTAAASRGAGALGACVAARYIRLVCAAKRSGLEAEPIVVRRHALRVATPSHHYVATYTTYPTPPLLAPHYSYYSYCCLLTTEPLLSLLLLLSTYY